MTAPAPENRQIVQELRDLGMRVARVLEARASQADDDHLPAIADAFDRVSRGVRRAVLLDERLGEPARARTAALRRIIRGVEDAIENEAPTKAAAERLNAELRERLDSPDLAEELDERPASDVTADICRDLGLGGIPGLKLHKRRTPADVAALCALARRSALRYQPDPGHPLDPERVFHIVPAPNDS